MSKTFFYQVFGIGKIPPDLMTQLRHEGILVMDEGVPGTATFRDFRSPMRYAAWKRQWYTASIVLTRERLLGLLRTSPIINVPLTDERLRQVEFTLEYGEAVLCVRFDANLFRKDWTGTVEYRFRTAEARNMVDRLKSELDR